jgi:hypothetical protein
MKEPFNELFATLYSSRRMMRACQPPRIYRGNCFPKGLAISPHLLDLGALSRRKCEVYMWINIYRYMQFMIVPGCHS